MRGFYEMWPLCEVIVGAFSQPEALRMYDVGVNQCPEGAVYLEIGSYLGRSSTLLGQIAKEKQGTLTCIDPFITAPWPPCNQTAEEIFRANMQKNDLPHRLIVDLSENVVDQVTGPLDLLFIDGNHHYEGVRRDIDNYMPKVKPNGLMLFHDYMGSWVGVRKAVDETPGLSLLGIYETLAIYHKL